MASHIHCLLALIISFEEGGEKEPHMETTDEEVSHCTKNTIVE